MNAISKKVISNHINTELINQILTNFIKLLDIYQKNPIAATILEVPLNLAYIVDPNKILTNITIFPEKFKKIEDTLRTNSYNLFVQTQTQIDQTSHLNDTQQSFITKRQIFIEHIAKQIQILALYVEQLIIEFAEADEIELEKFRFMYKQTSSLIIAIQTMLDAPEFSLLLSQNNIDQIYNVINAILLELIGNKGILTIKSSKSTDFTIGKDIANTAGNIIYRNDLIELIQYNSTTNSVYENPILFIPPWINKYYILDLSPEKSMVQWLINNGFTVYMISWINPDASLANKNWEDYVLEGPIAAINIISKNCDAKIHTVGYCIGGTLLASTLAYMHAINDYRVASASYFTTMLDFSNPGELKCFINQKVLNSIFKIIELQGYLDGTLSSLAFKMLRPNTMIWPYLMQKYLSKENTQANELLFWNDDCSNLPRCMVKYYLQNMYLENNLIIANRLQIKNTPVNLKNISTPAFFVAAEKDHLVPWESVYAGLKYHSGDVSFILSAPGHVVGIINPPQNNKYSFKVNQNIYNDPKQWLVDAKEHPGSWWPFWQQWLITIDNNKIPAATRAITPKDSLANAPGTYVHKQANTSISNIYKSYT